MRLVKGLILIAGLFVFLGLFFLFMDGGRNSEAQPQLEKPAIWGNDVLVHDGHISRYARNAFSSDYDEDSNHIYVAVAGHSSGPDTCWLYKSTNGGTTWTVKSYWPDNVDISNPQVVVGKGSHYYLFLFGRVNEENGNIVVNRMPLPSGSWTTYTIGGVSSCDIRNFVAAGEQGSVYNLHIAYDSDSGLTYYLRSNTYGTSWTYYDTLDGDQPHLVTAGEDGSEELYLTWRMDGQDGAFYGAYDSIWSSTSYASIAKNLKFGTGTWRRSLLCNYPSSTTCLLQASDGTIYAGIDTTWPDDTYAAVLKSQDGGETWTLTDDLGDQEEINDLLEGPAGTIYAATSKIGVIGGGVKVYKTTDGGVNWNNTGKIGEADDDHAYCLARSGDGTIYVGTGYEGDVFKTTDGGNDWDACAELTGAMHALVIIVTESGTVLAGGETSDSVWIFRSTNGGSSWSHKSYLGDCSIHALFQASDGTIYAGVDSGWGGLTDKIYKSTDDGVTWMPTNYRRTDEGRITCVLEVSDASIWAVSSSNSRGIYKTTNQGTNWTHLSGSPGLNDLIQSRPYIMVKKSTDRGVHWQSPKNISGSSLWYRDDPNSDPKVAATQGTSSYIVWVAYTIQGTGYTSLPYAYSTDKGVTWTQVLDPLGGHPMDASNQQLCDLRVKRGYSYVHAAYCDDISGSRKVYYRYSHSSHPDSWSDTVCISAITPTTYHTPEISFYQNNTVVFFCGQALILPTWIPNDLYVDASHFTGVEEEEEELSQPTEFSLSQNYPNPFNPVTSIQYTVGSRQRKAADSGQRTADCSPIPTTLKIYNVLGEKVRTLVDEPKEVGSYTVIWDGKDDQGKEVASGVYLCKLQMGEQSQTKKMVLMK